MTIIRKAKESELPEILALQVRAYQSEAELCQNLLIPPLTQTLEAVRVEFERGVFLVAISDSERIIGSVRGHVENGTGHIGKLIVDPDRQGQGIGSKLLSAIEELLQTERLELFTSVWSERNLGLYRRRGYQEFKRTEIRVPADAPDLTLVFLEKIR